MQAGYLVERSEDGSTWDTYIELADGTITNWTDTGDRAWNEHAYAFSDPHILVMTDIADRPEILIPIRMVP